MRLKIKIILALLFFGLSTERLVAQLGTFTADAIKGAATPLIANTSYVPYASVSVIDVFTNSNSSIFVTRYSGAGTNRLGASTVYRTKYYYRGRDSNSRSPSSYLNNLIALTIPVAPQATQATNVTSSSFNANWNGVTGATTYYLDLSTSSTFGTFVSGYNGYPLSGTSASLGSLTPGTTYYYRVRASNSSGSSSNSNTISVATSPTPVEPPVATAATAITATSFTANWKSVSGAQNYYLDVSTSSNFSTFVQGLNGYILSGTSYSISGLTKSTTYYYRVRAATSTGTSGHSNVISTTTLFAPTATLPSNPSLTSFTANWNSVAGATTCYIYVSINDSFTEIVQGLNGYPISGASTSFLITGLAPDTKYYFRLRVATSAGTSDYSNTISAFTLRAPVAIAATNVSLNSFTANWNISNATGLIQYVLEISRDDQFTMSAIAGYPNGYPLPGTSYTFMGIAEGTYYYRVRGYTNAGMSSYSNTISISTNEFPLPKAPGSVIGTDVTQNSFTAKWNGVAGATYYRFDVSKDNVFTSFVNGYNNLLVTGTAVDISGLTSNTNYYFRVRAVSYAGISLNSSLTSITTLAPSENPIAFPAKATTSTSFKASWNSVIGATTYRLDVSTVSNFSTYVPGYNNKLVSGTSEGVLGLNTLTGYFYRVRAEKSTGLSANSNVIFTTTGDHNYVRAINLNVTGKTTLAMVENATLNERTTNYVYFDGLGRPIQNITKQGSPSQKDIVQPIAYDAFGREDTRYLPYTDEANGWYKENALRDPSTSATMEQDAYRSGKQYAFYQTGGLVAKDPFPFSRIKFELSPTNRTLEKGSPGLAWQPDLDDSYSSADRTIKESFEFNSYDEVLLWSHSPSTSAIQYGLINASLGATPIYYPANTLFKTKTKDEQFHEVIEYKDLDGKVILKKVQGPASEWAQTYYIYDEAHGMLVCVLPPEAVKAILKLPMSEYFDQSDAAKEKFLATWAFRYQYDQRHRLIAKQAPGTSPVYFVYDNRDRLVLSQDGNQRKSSAGVLQKNWMFTKYDRFNRPFMTGLYIHSGNDTSQVEMQNYVNNQRTSSETSYYEEYNGLSASHGYTNRTFPITQSAVYSITYYDSYDFVAPLINGGDASITAFDYKNSELSGQESMHSTAVKGQITGIKTNKLGSGDFFWSVNYYDQKYRMIQNVSQHQKGTVRTTNIYNFINLTNTQRRYLVNNVETVVSDRFVYDHANRLLETWNKIGSQNEVLLVRNSYNELGQLIKKGLHKTGQNKPYVTADPEVGQPGINYATTISSSIYSTNTPTYIASQRVTLSPGFKTAGNNFKAKIGYSETDAQTHNATVIETFRQEVDMQYNIRGWLKQINDIDGTIESNDLFAMNLNYEQSSQGAGYFNGDISEIDWSSAEGEKQSYTYSYDPMNRLTAATYLNTTDPLKNGKFDEAIGDPANSRPAYDLNGNIRNILRNGNKEELQGSIDNLTYVYKGNRLVTVNDQTADEALATGFKELVELTSSGGSVVNDEYVYDFNGNMIKDANKGIVSIAYNHLNLPQQVNKTASDYIIYTYDASGRKIAQQVAGSEAKVTDYIGELVFENDVLKFVNHPEGRIIPSGSAWEYQYHLKDHLGNVRVTFTTKDETETRKATLEHEDQVSDYSNFLRYRNASRVQSALLDRTKGSSPGYVQRLAGTENERYGLAKSLSVMPGDVINTEVYAKYIDANTSNWTAALNTLMGQINAKAAGVVLEGVQYSSSTASFGYAGSINYSDNTGNAPKAYLNWLIFDRDDILLDGGYIPVSAAAREYGQDVAHERLAKTINITKAGYVYIYFSNENETPVEVYFDDFRVEHIKSPIVQMDDYYPFGLAFNSYQRENATPNNLKYQSWELQDELDLNIYSTEFRTYEPSLGRWMQIDPKANEFHSPYVGMGNNPLRYIDPLGDTIKDNNGIVANYRTYVAGRISGLQGMLGDKNFDFAKYGTSREAVEGLVSGLQGIGGELDAMQASEQVYNVGFSSDMAAGEGGMSFNAETGAVDISFGKFGNFDQSAGLVGHEMLHGYQFETGKVSMRQDNAGYGSLYDIGDETAAYQREHLVAGGVGSGGHINNQWTKNFGASMTPPAYQTLPSGSIDINSPQGMHMRMQSSVNGMFGRPATEAYKGWRGHYNQGARRRTP